jgi:hypothetical protein
LLFYYIPLLEFQGFRKYYKQGGDSAQRERKMKKVILGICVSVLVVGCISFNKTYQDSVALPEGTSLKTAEKIAMSVWNANYKEKMKAKFPNLTDDQVNGLFVKWNIFKQITGEKKTTVSIIVGIRYQGKVKNPRAITSYGKSLVEQAVREYMEKKR